MFAGRVGHHFENDSPPLYYISEAVGTGVSLDGTAMVRLGHALLPATDYVETRTEAKQQIVDQLVRHVGIVQATVDRLRDEILHEHLTKPEAAA